MILQDSSDSSLLVYSDWLEDEGRLEEAEEVRRGTREPKTQRWIYEWRVFISGVGGDGGGVGGGVGGGDGAGGGVVGGGSL